VQKTGGRPPANLDDERRQNVEKNLKLVNFHGEFGRAGGGDVRFDSRILKTKAKERSSAVKKGGDPREAPNRWSNIRRNRSQSII